MTVSGVTASAVSALTANAARVAAVADNVANVGTVGFKATQVRTTTVVTRQGAGGGFAAGGVRTVALEQSNVDLAGEFANLVQSPRRLRRRRRGPAHRRRDVPRADRHPDLVACARRCRAGFGGAGRPSPLGLLGPAALRNSGGSGDFRGPTGGHGSPSRGQPHPARPARSPGRGR